MLAAHLAATGETGSAPSRCSTRCSTTASRASSAPSPTSRPWPGWNGRWQQTGVLDGAQMASHLRPAARQRPHLQLRGLQLADGPNPAGVRHPGLERRHTRLPAAMHSFYLRSLYLRNELARGELTLAGQRLALPDIQNDTYVVGAVNDHIVPWEASYQTTGLLGGDVRYVLSSGGHIAGIVNPPGPKARYECWPAEHPADPGRVAGGGEHGRGPGGRTGPAGQASGPGRGPRRRRWAASGIRRRRRARRLRPRLAAGAAAARRCRLQLVLAGTGTRVRLLTDSRDRRHTESHFAGTASSGRHSGAQPAARSRVTPGP